MLNYILSNNDWDFIRRSGHHIIEIPAASVEHRQVWWAPCVWVGSPSSYLPRLHRVGSEHFLPYLVVTPQLLALTNMHSLYHIHWLTHWCSRFYLLANRIHPTARHLQIITVCCIFMQWSVNRTIVPTVLEILIQAQGQFRLIRRKVKIIYQTQRDSTHSQQKLRKFKFHSCHLWQECC